jgi:hypothetical protein
VYRVSGDELLVPIDPPLPPAESGAPMPVAILTEADCLLFYFGGLAVQGEANDEDTGVVLRFVGAFATMLGRQMRKR